MRFTLSNRPSPNPGVGAVLSLVIPGAGQMYRGKVGAGLFWLIVIPISYLLFFPVGLILHILCICDAYKEIRAF